MRFSRPTATCCWLLFLQGGMGDVTKGKRLFAGFHNLIRSSKSSCTVRWCTVYRVSAKKEVECKWMLTGGGRSGDISCQIEDVSCRRPRKSRESWYTKFVNL